MAENEIHVSDLGTVFDITIQDDGSFVDISGVTGAGSTKELIFVKPDETKVTQTAVFNGDAGAFGVIQYTTIAGDLDQHGRWQIQAYLVWPAGNTWYSDIRQFDVHPNL